MPLPSSIKQILSIIIWGFKANNKTLIILTLAESKVDVFQIDVVHLCQFVLSAIPCKCISRPFAGVIIAHIPLCRKMAEAFLPIDRYSIGARRRAPRWWCGFRLRLRLGSSPAAHAVTTGGAASFTVTSPNGKLGVSMPSGIVENVPVWFLCAPLERAVISMIVMLALLQPMAMQQQVVPLLLHCIATFSDEYQVNELVVSVK